MSFYLSNGISMGRGRTEFLRSWCSTMKYFLVHIVVQFTLAAFQEMQTVILDVESDHVTAEQSIETGCVERSPI